MTRKRAIIIGAGPAGLTAAHELLERTGIEPVVIETCDCVGGLCRTVDYKGNRIDIGGHRFFSKSDRVMEWWLRMLPLEATGKGSRASGKVMLLRPRKSSIFFLRQFFDYPIALSLDTLKKLGLRRAWRIGASYLRSALTPGREERTLEEFFINRFGRELYHTFFQSYTEKVWGVPCQEIGAEWGAQRVKGLSIWEAVLHAVKAPFRNGSDDLAQKNAETSLIGQFLYPKYGPGQLWEEVARRVTAMGGAIHTGCRATRLVTCGTRVCGVEVARQGRGAEVLPADYVLSSAPVQELLEMFDTPPPANVREVAAGLVYREFITVGLLVKTLQVHEETPEGKRLLRDNWIYIQEPDVQLGRLQIFNNWSPHLVADRSLVWLGLEYFCNASDAIWKLSDADMVALAVRELSRIGIVDAGDVLDSTVLRMEKTYPAYLGTYPRFDEIREHVDRYENLFLIGRNGMHRYNNQDHSMLTAMLAAGKIASGDTDKRALWEVNAEADYHEGR